MGCKLGKNEAENLAEEASEAGGLEGAGDDSPVVVVVFGATGIQGGSVIRALAGGDDGWTVKGVTRDPESDKAKALAELKGVELVKADLDDADSVKAAVEGATIVFGVTNFWDSCDKDKETAQGKAIVDACKAAGVKHLVYSGLENVEEELGKPCPHFDGKGAVEKYINEQEVPCTMVHLAAYYENLLGVLKPRKTDEGGYVLDLPMGDHPIDMVCASDCGECVRQIMKKRDEFVGKTIGLSSQKLTVDEYAAILTKGLTDKKVEAGTITVEELAAKDTPNAADFAAMFEFLQSGKAERDIELTRQLNPEISSFEQWVDSHKTELEAAME